MLKVDTQTYDEKLIIYFHSANKHPVSISYELLSDEHATVNNKRIRSASHQQSQSDSNISFITIQDSNYSARNNSLRGWKRKM